MSKQLPAGLIINNAYQILDCIGEGGLGVVYKALQLDLKRPVAIKMLKESYVELDCDWLLRFEREGQILAALDQPNVVKCYAAGFYQSLIPFLVFELLEGQSLHQAIIDSKLKDIKSVVSIGLQICDALKYTHSQNVIHRDLKPENIMLVSDGNKVQAKILDFGLATILESEAHVKLTRTGNLLGTVAYMSPEQCKGSPADCRSDIYSLGCILYECVARKVPHDADSAMGVLFKHMNEPPVAARKLNRNCPEALDYIINKTLCKEPKDRYQNIAELQVDLNKLQELLEFNDQIPVTLLTGKASTKSPVNLMFLLPWITAALIAILVFYFSDPGPAVLFRFAEQFVPVEKRENFCEEEGDKFLLQKHLSGSTLLYSQALTHSKTIASKMRLISKLAVISAEAGRKFEAESSVKEYLQLMMNPNCKKFDAESFERILTVMELVPIKWNNDLYYGIRCFAGHPLQKSYYQVNFLTLFAQSIADLEAPDSQWHRLRTFFFAVMLAEIHHDEKGKQQFIVYALNHLQKFGASQRALKQVLNKALLEKNKKFQECIYEVCNSGTDTNAVDKVSLLLAVLRCREEFLSARAFKFPLQITKFADFLKSKEALLMPTEFAILAQLLISQDALLEGDYSNFYAYAKKAVVILPQSDDSGLDRMGPYSGFWDWCLGVIISELKQSPSGSPARLDLLIEMDNFISEISRFVEGRLGSEIISLLTAEYCAEKKFVPAEKSLRNEISRIAVLDHNEHLYGCYYLLTELFVMQNKLEDAKKVIVDAEKNLEDSNSQRFAYPVKLAWGSYYLAKNNKKQSLRALQEGLDIAKANSDLHYVEIIQRKIVEVKSAAN